MVKDAEAHAEQDKARREAADTRNEAESVAYTTEKLLKGGTATSCPRTSRPRSGATSTS